MTGAQWVDGIVDKKLYPFCTVMAQHAPPTPADGPPRNLWARTGAVSVRRARTKALRKTAVYFHGNAVTLSDLCSGWIQSC